MSVSATGQKKLPRQNALCSFSRSGIRRFLSAVSSVVEHYLDTVGVTGSNPVSRTLCKTRSNRMNKGSADGSQICKEVQGNARKSTI